MIVDADEVDSSFESKSSQMKTARIKLNASTMNPKVVPPPRTLLMTAARTAKTAAVAKTALEFTTMVVG